MIEKWENINIPRELEPMVLYYATLTSVPKKFLKALENFSNNKGYSYNAAISEFSTEYVPDEMDYFENGVRFIVDIVGFNDEENEVIVDFNTFYDYLIIASDIFVQEYPEYTENVSIFLTKIHKNINILD
jgi:hypothetical protein